MLPSDLRQSFFHLSREDPTQGFTFDATRLAGHGYPNSGQEPRDENLLSQTTPDDYSLRLHLHVASHLATHIRTQLEVERGYTCTGGISTSKLLSKLVGAVKKPQTQTTLLPPYVARRAAASNVALFIDDLEVGKIPGIGFKTAVKLRELVLKRPPAFDGWLMNDDDRICVRDVKAVPGINSAEIDRVLSGPGSPQGFGSLVWNLLNGVDNTQVSTARDIPKQISIEDSYVKLDTVQAVVVELTKLAISLIKRMRLDLMEISQHHPESTPRWLGRPRTLRLSTRPRAISTNDGDTKDSAARSYFHSRTSRNGQVPSFLFSVEESIDSQAARLVRENLMPLFYKLHPEQTVWNLSLINVAVTHMQETASESKGAIGRNIENMFRKQEEHLKEWTAYAEEEDILDDTSGLSPEVEMGDTTALSVIKGSEDDTPWSTQRSQQAQDWIQEEESAIEDYGACPQCGAFMPAFAMAAHQRFHSNGE